MKKSYAYILIDPRSSEIKYVGKTNNPSKRLARHKTEKGHTDRHRWLADLLEKNIMPVMKVVDEFDDDLWKEKERYWIEYYRSAGHNLLNIADGGNGARGDSPSEATRKKLSDALKKSWEGRERIPMTDEKKLVFSRRGIPLSPEGKEKMRISMTGKKKSPEHIKNMSIARTGVKFGPISEEKREKLRVQKLGEKNPMAKLTYEIADEIRGRYSAGGVSLSQLGEIYSVDTRQISRIVRREAWVK